MLQVAEFQINAGDVDIDITRKLPKDAGIVVMVLAAQGAANLVLTFGDKSITVDAGDTLVLDCEREPLPPMVSMSCADNARVQVIFASCE